MSLSTSKKLSGFGYVALNAIRVCNIVCLLAVVIASIFSLIKIKITNQVFLDNAHGGGKIANTNKFWFFEAVTHIISASIATFLAVSECNIFRQWYNRNWPLLGPDHGFVFLGCAMLGLGVDMLANLNKPNMSKKSLGTAIWSMVIGAGIIIFIFGVTNVAVSYVFRSKSAGVTSRMVRSKGAVADIEAQMNQKSGTWSSSNGSTRTGSHYHSPTMKKSTFTPRLKTPDTSARSPIKFPQFGRQTTVPQNIPGQYPRPTSSHYSPQQAPGREMQISGPIGINPQFAHLVRPDSAYHPSKKMSNPFDRE